MSNIVIIQGHPDPGGKHYCHALAESYAEGAREGGHQVRQITVAALDFPLLRSKQEWDAPAACPPAIADAQRTVGWADHLLIVYPLWLGTMPALLKAFLEQLLRPGFAFGMEDMGVHKPLKGKTARVVVTMGMPDAVYRWFFLAHSLRSLQRNILSFVGVRPVGADIIGMVEAKNPRRRERWLARLRREGGRGR